MILRIEQQDKSYIKLSPYKWISYQYKVIADHVINTAYITMLTDNYSKRMFLCRKKDNNNPNWKTHSRWKDRKKTHTQEKKKKKKNKIKIDNEKMNYNEWMDMEIYKKYIRANCVIQILR